MSASKVQTIVVVGGGFAGAGVAKSLASKLDTRKHRLILVTASERFAHMPSTIRCVTTPEGRLENHSFMPYGEFLGGRGEIMYATVESFTSSGKGGGGGGGGEVKLSTGETVGYDVLVLASGSKWAGALAFPNSAGDVKHHLDSWRAKIEKAQSIVLVGGGVVGVEFSGEISDFHKGKNITIVHGERLPLNATYPDRFRSSVLARLRKRGVNVILEDKVDNLGPSENGTIKTKSGKVLNADLVIPTFGGSPNTDFIKESLGEDALVGSKHVKVLATLQLRNHSNIFAVGDIIDWNEQRQAAKVPGHVAVVVKNVLSALNGRVPSAQYKGSYEIIVITQGRTGGVSYFGVLWGLIFGDWFSALVKSKTLLIGTSKSQFGF